MNLPPNPGGRDRPEPGLPRRCIGPLEQCSDLFLVHDFSSSRSPSCSFSRFLARFRRTCRALTVIPSSSQISSAFQPLQVPQNDDFPVLLRQRLHRPADSGECLLVHRRFCRRFDPDSPRPAASSIATGRRRRSRRNRWLRHLLTVMVKSHVRRLALAAELLQSHERRDEDFLDDVVHVPRPAEQTIRQGRNLGRMLLHDLCRTQNHLPGETAPPGPVPRSPSPWLTY